MRYESTVDVERYFWWTPTPCAEKRAAPFNFAHIVMRSLMEITLVPVYSSINCPW
jgi:hypothetical protein